MSNPRHTEADLRKTIETIEQCFRDGFAPPGTLAPPPNAYAEAARRLGLGARQTIHDRVKRAEGIGLPPPDTSLWVDPNYASYQEIHAPPVKPVVRVRAITNETPPEGQTYRIVAIGDHHDRPGRDKSHATWMGRFIAETSPDYVVSIGDWTSLDSLSQHDKPGSAQDAARPTFPDDLESLEESLHAFHRDFPVGSIPVFQTHGNHEFRAQRAANMNPKECADIALRVDQTFARFRWHTKPYGDWLFIGSVGFIHHPFNSMGKPYGGKNPEQQIGNDATYSIVMGHTHKRKVHHVSKIGPNNRITVLNLGTSLPYGEIEHYAGISTTGWTYGVYLLTIRGGQIIGEQYVSMIELEERFCD